MSKRLVILGGGESGVGAALLAQQQNYTVFVSDFSMMKTNYKKELSKASIPFEENQHTENLILNADIIVKSPGIPEKAPIVKKLRNLNIPIVSEIEFAYQFVKEATIVGITGSNGKTTTTSMTYQILKDDNLDVALAGNIGESFARKVSEKQYSYYVLEISSFQLDDIQQFTPDIAVLMNITPDHLDRYQYDFDQYANSKFRIIENQTEQHHFIYCDDDETIQKHLKERETKTTMHPFSIEHKTKNGACVLKDKLEIQINEDNMEMTISELGLKGKHNLYNSMAAGIAGRLLNLRKKRIKNSLYDFTNLEHRLESVLHIRGVEFINDSKATNINSVWYALETMERPVIWIAGGVDKGNDYTLIEELVKDKVKALVSLGNEVENIHKSFEGKIPEMVNSQSIEEAVFKAYNFAEKGDVVLLSPACASFDMFENYEERGTKFKEAVRQL